MQPCQEENYEKSNNNQVLLVKLKQSPMLQMSYIFAWKILWIFLERVKHIQQFGCKRTMYSAGQCIIAYAVFYYSTG